MKTNRTAGWVIRARLLTLIAAVALMGNNCFGTSAGTSPPAQSGNYITLDAHCYPFFGTQSIFNDPTKLSNADVPEIQGKFSGPQWNRIEAVEDDPNCVNPGNHVVASHFTDSTAHNADWIWFSGHGDAGVPVLFSYDTDTAQAAGGFDCNQGDPNQDCFWSGSAGMPISGRLKWIFAYASQDTDNQSWASAFNTQASGLHGYYGVEGEPQDLDSVSRRVADIFAAQSVGSGNNDGLTLHSAWINAVAATTNRFGEWELSDARNDKLSSTAQSSGLFSASNPVIYTNADDSYTFTISPQSLSSNSPGTYQPIALSTESYSDSSLAAKASAAESGPRQYYPSPNEYRLVSQTYVGSHFEASQGLLIGAEHSQLPFNYAQSDALAFATSFVQQQGNSIPADAQLQNVQQVLQTQQGQAPVVTGYIFTWVHRNLMLGGDYIRVGVDNLRTRYCAQPNENDPPNDKPPCYAWAYEYDQRVNLYYRLWREPTGSTRYPLGVHGSGSPALSAAQAFSIASSSPSVKGNVGTFQGYVYSYWTPGIDSTDNTAYPAYHFFYSNHAVVSVDAYSGAVLDINGAIQ